MITYDKLYGVAPLVAESPPTNSTTNHSMDKIRSIHQLEKSYLLRSPTLQPYMAPGYAKSANYSGRYSCQVSLYSAGNTAASV